MPATLQSAVATIAVRSSAREKLVALVEVIHDPPFRDYKRNGCIEERAARASMMCTRSERRESQS
jgi:hypothetical protein